MTTAATSAASRRLVVPAQPAAGDPRHGVNRYATAIAAAVANAVRAAPTGDRGHEDAIGAARTAGRVHVHFTDRLWGDGPEDAAAAFARFAAARPVTVTLHDVPQPSDGPRNLPRRAAAYRQVLAAARAVACNSHHEAALLREHVEPSADPAVIPHAVHAAPAPLASAPDRDGRPDPPAAPRATSDGTIAVLGWIYPGKGHTEVIEAAARLGGVPVVALGRPSDGHEAAAAALAAHAARLGVPFTVTGFLGDAELLDRCRRASVPIAAHRHVSASGSLATWIGAGRRPLAPDGRYTREVAALRPGTVTPYPPDAMAAAIDRARRVPDTTWIAPGASLKPDVADVARAYLRWWTEAVTW